MELKSTQSLKKLIDRKRKHSSEGDLSRNRSDYRKQDHLPYLSIKNSTEKFIRYEKIANWSN